MCSFLFQLIAFVKKIRWNKFAWNEDVLDVLKWIRSIYVPEIVYKFKIIGHYLKFDGSIQYS